MTDSEPTVSPAGSGAQPRHFAIAREGNRIELAGQCKTPGDREQLRSAVDQTLSINAGQYDELVLDVRDAAYLDVAFLTLLIGFARQCVSCGMVLALEGANEETLSALRMTRIDQVLGRHGVRIAPAEAT